MSTFFWVRYWNPYANWATYYEGWDAFVANDWRRSTQGGSLVIADMIDDTPGATWRREQWQQYTPSSSGYNPNPSKEFDGVMPVDVAVPPVPTGAPSTPPPAALWPWFLGGAVAVSGIAILLARREPVKSNPYTPRGEGWPVCEYKLAAVKKNVTITTSGGKTEARSGEYIVFFLSRLPGQGPTSVPVGVYFTRHDADEAARRMATKHAKTEPRNPNKIRILDEHGFCFYALVGSESGPLRTTCEDREEAMPNPRSGNPWTYRPPVRGITMPGSPVRAGGWPTYEIRIQKTKRADSYKEFELIEYETEPGERPVRVIDGHPFDPSPNGDIPDSYSNSNKALVEAGRLLQAYAKKHPRNDNELRVLDVNGRCAYKIRATVNDPHFVELRC